MQIERRVIMQDSSGRDAYEVSFKEGEVSFDAYHRSVPKRVPVEVVEKALKVLQDDLGNEGS